MATACSQQETGDGSGKSATEQLKAPLSTEQVVSKRALERIAAVADGRYETAYSYLSEGNRSLLPLKSFVARLSQNPAIWKKGEVSAVRCNEDVCDLSVEVSYIYRGSLADAQGEEFTTQVNEKWIRNDGNWFLVQGAE